MKKVILVAGLFISYLTVFSQSESNANEKRMKYGLNIGINYSNLLDNEMLPSNASISNDLGFRLGILADYRIFKFLSVSPKAELSFNNSKVNFTQIDGSETEYEIMPVSLNFMTHFIFKKNNEKLIPYFFFGPNVKVPISEKSNNSMTFGTNSDFAIDFGIGVDKPLTDFNILIWVVEY